MLIVNLGTHLFDPGRIVVTPGAEGVLAPVEVFDLTGRHFSGDWGDLDDHDRTANDAALKSGGRILSSYRTGKGEKVWIITEGDRSATTILLPEDY